LNALAHEIGPLWDCFDSLLVLADCEAVLVLILGVSEISAAVVEYEAAAPSRLAEVGTDRNCDEHLEQAVRDAYMA
jgi:hypothetical protein